LNPVASSLRSVAADIAVSGSQIGFSFRGNDDSVDHLPCRVFPLQLVEHFVGGPSCAFSGLN